MGLKRTITNLLVFCDKNSPTILTAFGIVGTGATGILAYRSGMRAHDILERHHEDMDLVDEDDKEAKRAVMSETILDMIPVIMPPLIMGTFTIGCIFMSNQINAKRIAVLATAYGISEKKLREYQDKVTDILGEKKAQDIRESISKDHIEQFEKENGPISNIQPLYTGYGDMPTIDEFSKRVFGSSCAKIDAVVSRLTQRVFVENYVSLNDLYDELGLERLPHGDRFGWIADDIMGTGKLPIYSTPHKDDNNTIVLNLEYDLHTRRDYRELTYDESVDFN